MVEGDIIRYVNVVDGEDIGLTLGNYYQVLTVSTLTRDTIQIKDDDGVSGWYYSKIFITKSEERKEKIEKILK